jgi:hypothetical protein
MPGPAHSARTWAAADTRRPSAQGGWDCYCAGCGRFVQWVAPVGPASASVGAQPASVICARCQSLVAVMRSALGAGHGP